MYNVTFEQFINYIAKILRISVHAQAAEPNAQVKKMKVLCTQNMGLIYKPRTQFWIASIAHVRDK